MARKQTKITKSARGENCLTRIPGVCKHRTDTVVFAHMNGGGSGTKSSDAHGSYSCFECHAWLDGGYAQTHTRTERDLWHLEAIIRTQIILFNKGLLAIT